LRPFCFLKHYDGCYEHVATIEYGLADHIQFSDSTYSILKNKYNFADRGKIMIKGKGEMQTYFLINNWCYVKHR
jgi:hypothetical protein